MIKISIPVFLILFFFSCKKEVKETISTVAPEKEIIEFGYNLKDFKVVRDTIQNGQNFSEILDTHHVAYPKVLEIVAAVKDTFDVRSLRSGKPYTILASKDSLEKAKVFIYQKNKIDYVAIDFTEEIKVENNKKPIRIETKEASGLITSSLSQAIDDQGLNTILAHELSDVYAWSIDFFHLQKGDKFKIIYEQRFINDTVPAGIGEIKAALFEHKGVPFYAFNYVADSTKNISDYYNEEAKTLRRQFLKAPLKFSRISSRFNLKRRIKFYGNRVRPHKGTDFAAPVGSPILATANGTVIKSERRGGNGNYVKIKHNGTYSTQYLHMKKRMVRVGDFVKQGDVIGTVGMTGNTSGPHVCYRFWKNGVQVDPFKQKLPAADPIAPDVKAAYLTFISPLKESIDSITYPKEVPEELLSQLEVKSNAKNKSLLLN